MEIRMGSLGSMGDVDFVVDTDGVRRPFRKVWCCCCGEKFSIFRAFSCPAHPSPASRCPACEREAAGLRDPREAEIGPRELRPKVPPRLMHRGRDVTSRAKDVWPVPELVK